MKVYTYRELTTEEIEKAKANITPSGKPRLPWTHIARDMGISKGKLYHHLLQYGITKPKHAPIPETCFDWNKAMEEDFIFQPDRLNY